MSNTENTMDAATPALPALKKRKPPPHAWQKGAPSPNPHGRPPGVPALAVALREAVTARKDELVKALLDKAVQGNAEALRLVAERFAPVSRSSFEARPIPGLDAARLEDQVAAVRAALARGDISADVAGATLAALKDGAMAERLDQLTKRLAALEASETIDVGGAYVDGRN